MRTSAHTSSAGDRLYQRQSDRDPQRDSISVGNETPFLHESAGEGQQQIQAADKKQRAAYGNDSSTQAPEVDKGQVYVGGLPPDVSDDFLLTLLNEASGGGVTSINIPKHSDSNQNKSFGFVHCTPEAAKMLAEIGTLPLEGASSGSIKLALASSKPAKSSDRPPRRQESSSYSSEERPVSPPSPTIVVRNLDFEVDGKDLRAFFQSATDARVLSNPDNGLSRGFVQLHARAVLI